MTLDDAIAFAERRRVWLLDWADHYEHPNGKRAAPYIEGALKNRREADALGVLIAAALGQSPTPGAGA